MAVKKRCGFCNKHLVNVGTAEKPHWVCKNEKCPRYVPDPEPEPTPETPSDGTATPSEGDTTPTVETPPTSEPAQSDGNTETEPKP
jgi:hypothetical protein